MTYNYKGCRVQNYLGRDVEWCFCTGDFCNGASRESLAILPGTKNPSKSKYKFNAPSYIDMKKLTADKQAKALTPGSTYETYDYDAKYSADESTQSKSVIGLDVPKQVVFALFIK